MGEPRFCVLHLQPGSPPALEVRHFMLLQGPARPGECLQHRVLSALIGQGTCHGPELAQASAVQA